MMSPMRSSAPSKDPMTMPAMAPPLRPADMPLFERAPAVPVGDAVEEAREDVDEGKRAPIAVVIGNRTLAHRVSVLENKQQESVELGDEAAQ